MKRKYFNNSIISFLLIISTILMPLSFIPKKAEAQSISGYATGLGPIISTLPQCKDTINSGMKSLFRGIGSLFSSGNDSVPLISEDEIMGGLDYQVSTLTPVTDETLDDLTKSAKSTATAQPVADKTAQDLLTKIAASSEANRKAAENLNANSSCIQSIGRLIIKMLLQKLTVSTVKWINSGFNGSPAFIQDSSKFFGDIAKNEVLRFGLEINDPQLFPFGKVWMQNTAIAFNNKFQDNARYSLNELIQKTNPEYSAVTFQEDFSQGGWNAWTAMTQVPANNPLGFKLMADNELQQRLAGTTQSTAQATHEALQAANGFLGDQRCADPVGITKQQNDEALATGDKEGVCKRWEYVTPGSMVAYAAQNTIGYQNNAYLNVEDLNDAVAAITDALLGQFSSSIMENGFANLSNQGADGTLYNTSITSTGVIFQSQTEKDFMPSQLTSSWLAANPDFNIRTDLTQALIDEQRTYSDKLALQNKELNSTTDGKPYKLDANTGVSNASGLMPAIYQLDYCIPGPHPGWEQDSSQTLKNITTPTVDQQQTSNTSLNNVISAGLSIIPTVGPVLSAIFGSFLDSCSDAGEMAYNTEQRFRFQFFTLTNYLPKISKSCTQGDPVELNMQSVEGLNLILSAMLDRYANIMNKTYFSSPDYLPPVATEAAADFNQLTGYKQMIKDNEAKILLLKTTVEILGQIKDAVDNLNKDYPDGGEEYESELKTQINAFGRLSAEMVNGNDIANADNIYRQIKDKKDYIYKNLLKGPYGCEAWMADSNNIKNFPSVGIGLGQQTNDWDEFNVNTVKRMNYPSPIIYDYNIFAAGTQLPDPWESGYKGTDLPNMPANNEYDNYGPGFLSFVYLTNSGEHGKERLNIDDLVDTDRGSNTNGNEQQSTQYWVSVGNVYFPNSAIAPGRFETTIGVY